MKILAIDPALTVSGWAFVETEDFDVVDWKTGVIKTSRSSAIEKRVGAIYSRISEIIYEVDAGCLTIESGFVGRNFNTALSIGQVRGACMIAAVTSEIPFTEYAPREIKLAVAHGNASKSEVAEGVANVLRVDVAKLGDVFDQSDALAVAICHLNNLREQKIISEARE